MKFAKNFQNSPIVKLLMLTLLISFSQIQAFHLGSRAYAVFSFSNSNVSLSGPTQNNFKGHVSLDKDGRGIVITAGEGGQNEALLRLVSEKLDSDSYLIDYRLMRSCDFTIKFSQDKNNLIISFSPQSLENRNKNDKFDIQVEIYNYRTFIPDDKYKTEEDIKAFLSNQCEERKKTVSTMKRNLELAILDYHKKSKELGNLNKKIYSQSQETENLKTAIQETEAQVKDITYLQNSYEMQLKSIFSITSGANKLISKENDKKIEIMEQIANLQKEISDKSEFMKNKEDNLSKLKDKYAKTMEKSKDVENSIINYQKELADIENSLSNLNSNKLRLDFELKNTDSRRISAENSVNDISLEINKYNKKNKDNLKKINKLTDEKNKVENFISDEKEEIKKLEREINDLILKKSKKEENLKNKFDQIKNKEDQIANLKIDSEQYISNIKRLTEKKEKLEGAEKSEISFKIENLVSRIDGYKSEQKKINANSKRITQQLKEMNDQKETVNKNLNDLSKDIDNINNEISSLNKSIMDLEKKRTEMSVEIRDKESKLKNLKSESVNYSTETETVKKSLNSAKENLKTFNGILTDFKAKLTPVELKYKTLLKDKTRFERAVKDQKRKIKDAAAELKKTTPSAVVMIDLAEDEAFNDLVTEDTSDGKAKWKVLVDKIIS